MIDYSFIRLKPTLNEALDIGDCPLSQFIYYNQIHLLPNENYLQITNIKNGIAFDNDYKAEIVDCSDNILADITQNVGIYEFIDKNGVNQISFELAKLGVDFGFQAVSLKLSHTTSDAVFYSNPFVITSEFEYETTRYDYKSYGYFNGISYDKVPFTQSIRLNFWFDNVESQTEVSDYYQITNGNTVSTRALYKQLEKFKSEYLNRFTYERANVLLIHDVIYSNSTRITNKPQIKNNDRLGYSNIFESSFSCFKDYNDEFDYGFQILDELSLNLRSPLGRYDLTSLPTLITGSFNRNVTLGSGFLEVRDSLTDNLLAYYTEDDITLVGNSFSIDNTGIITTNGTYYILVSSGLFYDIFNIYDGISNSTEWQFIVSDADFNGIDFNNTDFFTP